jgi:hypothetical protein
MVKRAFRRIKCRFPVTHIKEPIAAVSVILAAASAILVKAHSVLGACRVERGEVQVPT